MGLKNWLKSFFISSYEVLPPELARFEKNYREVLEIANRQAVLIRKLQKESLEWKELATFWAQQLKITIILIGRMSVFVPEELRKKSQNVLNYLSDNVQFQALMLSFEEKSPPKKDKGNENPNFN